MSILAELLADCDAQSVRLTLAGDGGLAIDAPSGVLTPDLMGRLKAHKDELLALLRLAIDSPAPSVEATQAAPAVAAKLLCRCGSTVWRDVPIHDGQSVRRDCAKCGRFLEFTIWRGKNTGHIDQHSIG